MLILLENLKACGGIGQKGHLEDVEALVESMKKI